LLASSIEKFCWRKLYATCDVSFTAVGQTTLDELNAIGIEQATYVPNGVNSNIFRTFSSKKEIRLQLGLPENAKIILSLGRVTHQKMPFELIDIFTAIKLHANQYVLIVIGTGELLVATKTYVKTKKIPSVTFLGFVPDDQLPCILASADYYLTSTGYESGQPPLAMLEAMACGLPPIVPPLLKHVIIEANCGLFFNSTADILNYLNAVKYEEHSLLARKYAEEHDWSVIGELYSDFFLKKISGSNIR
jgi:glycosyltransferase involved in cell wall biosynthesis